MTEFKDIEAKIKKLHQWGLIGKRDTKFNEFIYKDKGKQRKCNIIGYLSKKTNTAYISPVDRGCISPVYETLIISVDRETHRISIDYLKDMQKLSKGMEV